MQCIIYNVIQLFWMHEPNILQQSTNSYYQKKNWEMWKCIKVCYSNEDQGNHSPINERLQQFNECNETSSMDFNTFEWMDQMFYNNQPTVIGWGSKPNHCNNQPTVIGWESLLIKWRSGKLFPNQWEVASIQWIQWNIFNGFQHIWMNEPIMLQQSTNSYRLRKQWEMSRCIKILTQMKIRETSPQSMRGIVTLMQVMKHRQWVTTDIN